MMACNPSGKAILLTQHDFATLSTELLNDLGPLDVASFKMAATQSVGIGSAKENYKKWEALFCERLLKEIRENRFIPSYDFEKGEAQVYIEDFLESYRCSYLHINYAVGNMHDRADEIINISLREKQSVLNKLFRRYGTTYAEINILKSEIRRLQGTSLDFLVEVGSSEYRFGPDGVSQIG